MDFQGAEDDVMQQSFDYNGGVGGVDGLVAHQDGGIDVDVNDMLIRVVVRKRPISRQELSRGERDVMDIESGGKVFVHEPKTKVDLTKIIETQGFVFDDAFDHIDNNLSIYSRTVKPLVYNIFTGGKATCFAYGQTGSGKTFTMMGSRFDSNFDPNRADPGTTGLYVLAAMDIFQILMQPQFQHLKAYLSCFEIYGGKLFDLLNDRSEVKCLEDAKQQVQIKGLSEHGIDSVDSLLQAMRSAFESRSVGSTGANAESSRSHLIMQIELKELVVKQNMNNVGIARLQKRVVAADAGAAKMNTVGKLSFIDLAGSERGADTTHNNKQTRLEGAEINTSLLALKEVIRSWNKKANHTPFRGSKLTQVLKDSFVGENTRTCMIACVSPSNGNCEHTLNTLRYADRVKEHKSERQDDNNMNTDGNSNNNNNNNSNNSNNSNYNNLNAQPMSVAQPSGRPSSAGPGAYPFVNGSGHPMHGGGGGGGYPNNYNDGIANRRLSAGPVGPSGQVSSQMPSSNSRLSVGGLGANIPGFPVANFNSNNNNSNSNSSNTFDNRPATTSSVQTREIVSSGAAQPSSNSRQSLGLAAAGGGGGMPNPNLAGPARRVSDVGNYNANGMNDRRLSQQQQMQVPPPTFFEEDQPVTSFHSNRPSLNGAAPMQIQNQQQPMSRGFHAQVASPLLTSTDMIQKTVQLLTSHKGSIGYMVEVMRGEMQLVQNMENAEDRDSEVYVDKLEEILASKSEAISNLRAELRDFRASRQLVRQSDKPADSRAPFPVKGPGGVAVAGGLNKNPNPNPNINRENLSHESNPNNRGVSGLPGASAGNSRVPSSRLSRK